MTTPVFEENFDTFGTGQELPLANMRQGIFAFIGDTVVLNDSGIQISEPSFDDQGRRWLQMSGSRALARAVFPSGETDDIGCWFRFFTPQLPASNTFQSPLYLLDSANQGILRMDISPTGQIVLTNSADVVIAQTALPVITASTIHRIQIEVSKNGNLADIQVRLDETSGDINEVLNVTGVDLPGNSFAQWATNHNSVAGTSFDYFIESVAVYDLDGAGVGQFPSIAGVATLFVNEDTVQNGFEAQPQAMTNGGFLRLQTQQSRVEVEDEPEHFIAGNDFTLELDVAFTQLPGGSAYSHLAGRWDENSADRSYQLRYNGPDQDGGGLQFRYSTDGTVAGIVSPFNINFTPVIGVRYHIAVVREAGLMRLFIDGVVQGNPVPDTGVFSQEGTLSFFVGGEDGNDTFTNGRIDEVRLTNGIARYSANFTPVRPHGRDAVQDPDFAQVALLLGFDEPFQPGSNAFLPDVGNDESSVNATVELPTNSDAFISFVDDDEFSFQTISQSPPADDSYIRASLLPGEAVLNLSVNVTDTETVTIDTTTYTFVNALTGANDVLIGATPGETLENLQAAINGEDGVGITFGVGTTPHPTVTSEAGRPTVTGITVTALVAGVASNSIVVSDTLVNDSWTTATLVGGADIPPPSRFNIENLPQTATGVRWLSVRDRSAIDLGSGTREVAFGVNGLDSPRDSQALTGEPRWNVFRLDTDPSTGGALTPTSIVNGSILIDRTE